MRSRQEIKQFLLDKPGYLKKGPWALAHRLESPVQVCTEVLAEVKNELKNENTSENRLNREDYVKTSSLQKFLQTHGINEASVSSVKFWQTSKGDMRYSIVTADSPDIHSIRKELQDFAEDYAPIYPKQNYRDLDDPVAYEISLPDIHYGKLVDAPMPYNFQEEEYIRVVEN